MSNFFKKTIASVFAVATLSLLINPVTINAGFDPNYKLPKESAQAKPITLTQPTTVLGKNGKIKVKVVKNQSGELEIDNQLGAKPTKEQEKAFETCKKEVQKTRTKRYKNKPTPCIKTPVSDGEHTDQDYSILWEGVNQNIERDKGADMNKEIPLSEILKEADVDTCESDTSVSSIITVSSAISTSSAVSSCTAISSSLSTSSSSAISSSSSQLSSSAVSSSSVVSSSNTSSNLSSSSVINSSLQNKQSSTLSSSSTSSRLSVLDMIFGSVKASAATNDGWRLPFESGQRPYLTQTPYGVGTNHSKYSAFDFDGASGNGNIVAAKSGKVVFKQFEAVDSIGKNTLKGFGNHIVIQSGDGSTALYAHLKTIDVKDGDTVDRGKKVGNQGNSGNSTASHLHFETWSRIPCQYNPMPESCWVNGVGNQYYLDSGMLPQFDECYKDRGGNINTYPDCSTGGYPNKAMYWFQSINSSTTTTPTPTTSKVLFRRKGTNQCLNIYNPRNDSVVNTWTCNTSDGDQKWEVVPVGTDGTKYNYKRVGTNQCLNAYNPYNGMTLKTWTCDGSAEQQFNYSWITQKLSRVGTNSYNQCVAKNGPSDGATVVTSHCDAWNDPNYQKNFQWEVVGI